MQFEIKLLEEKNESDYEEFLKNCDSSLFNHSIKYRNFLSAILKNSKHKYFCFYEKGQIEAVLPTFIQENKLGRVVNSLPYYGSHGGILKGSNFTKAKDTTLFNQINELCAGFNALSCTIVESPTDNNCTSYDLLKAEMIDSRIGQITSLPKRENCRNYRDTLLHSYHSKTRNLVRKGMKGDFDICHNGSWHSFLILYEMHCRNMKNINGKAKELSAFKEIYKGFNYDEDYRIYQATKNGVVVACMLIFYYKDTVEYFTPTIKEEFRNKQPLSALILNAMYDAVVEKDLQRWNWGGTWLNQSGVYHFKARWGAKDYPYKYHIKTSNDLNNVIDIERKELLSEFKDFYVYPFG